MPVPADLESYAVFDVPVVHVRLHGSDIELDYQLPASLVGNDQELSFRGPVQPDASGAYVLSGDSGQAKCQYLDEAFSCHETLSNIEIDRDKVQEKYADLPAPERAAHLAVTNVFSDDPIGVLRLAP